MKTPFFKMAAISIAASCVFNSAQALEIESKAVGTASLQMSGGPATVKATALRMAKRKAVLGALDKVVGAGTKNNPKVQEKLDELVEQVGEDVFFDPTPEATGDEYRVSITLKMDDKELRTLISDLGLALNTTTVRSQSFLVIMDEFFTRPTDLKAPLEELVEFKHEEGSHYNEKEAAAKSSKSASAYSSSEAHANKSSEAGAYKGSQDTRVAGAANDGYGGRAAVAGRDTTKVSSAYANSNQSADAKKVSAASASSSNAAYAHNISAEDHDNTYYKKLVKYQPQNVGPDKKNYTYNELKGQLTDLDIKVLDNAMFRSKYFGNKPITLDQLENGAELAKYVDFARKDAIADYMMMGTAVIYDNGIDSNTGQSVCTGVASTKNFSTKTSEDIGSSTQSATASGANADDCRAKLATKLASDLSGQVGKRVEEYFKRRNMYGSEFVIKLTGSNLPLMTRAAFSQALKGVQGVENQTQRGASAENMEVVVSYKGGDPLDQALAMALAAYPQFASLDSMVDGNIITLCMNGCPKPKAAAPAGKPAKK